MYKEDTALRKTISSSAMGYEEALRICERVAKEEYNFANEALVGATDLVDALRQDLKSAGKPRRGSSKASYDASAQIEELERKLDSSASEAVAIVQRALAKKAERLSKFTVTLFGRTMAGKSTIREAITHGDGGTIGKGAQRTTRDIREYDWNELRVVDTPGIGAYEGDADRELALSVVDESDLLLCCGVSSNNKACYASTQSALQPENALNPLGWCWGKGEEDLNNEITRLRRNNQLGE